MEHFGLIGRPLMQSPSQLIFNTVSRLTGKEEEYFLLEVREPLGDVLRRMHDSGVLGFNVTLPFKKEIIPYLDGIDPEAEAVGAVNCCIRTKRGYYGYNADAPGFSMSMDRAGIGLSGRNILIIGAGGAAYAALYACMKKKPASVVILNRDPLHAKELKNHAMHISSVLCGYTIPVCTLSYEEQAEYLRQFSGTPVRHAARDDGNRTKFTAIQCTSVGMYPDTDAMPPVCDEFFAGMEAAADLVYNPMRTAFLQKAGLYADLCLPGLDMLIDQALISREYWLGEKTEERVREQVKNVVTQWLCRTKDR